MLGPRRVHDSPRSGRRLRFAVPVLLAAAGATFLGLSESAPEFDDDLCPEAAGDLAGRTVALFDLRKPLDEGQRSLPAQLLLRIATALPPGAELRAHILSGHTAEPRTLLERLCKPPLQAGTADGPAADICATPSPSGAGRTPETDRYCTRRNALAARLERLAARPPAAPVTDAYLIEALEDISADLSGGTGPITLYVLSDMLQHAPWYSHLELADWDPRRFTTLRDAQTALVGPPPPRPANLRTTLFWIPRRGLTAEAEPAGALRAFWQAYFAAGVTVDVQAVMEAYAFAPRKAEVPEVTVGAFDGAWLEAGRARAAELRRRLEAENAALAEARQRALAERRANDRSAQQRKAEGDRVEALRTEVARRRAELAQTGGAAGDT